MSHINASLPHGSPLQTEASENTEGLVALGGERAHSLFSLLYFPAQMPNYHSWFPGEKRPLTLPQAPGCQPICCRERRGRAFPIRSWRINWKICASRETHLLDLGGMSVPMGKGQPGAAHQVGCGAGARAGTEREGEEVLWRPRGRGRPSCLLVPTGHGMVGTPSSLRPVSPARRRQAPPQAGVGQGR